MRNTRLGRDKGFTLIELLTVLTIVAIAANFAVPAMSEQIKGNRLISNANQLQSVFKFARSEAAKRDAQIVMNEDKGEWLIQLQGQVLQKFTVNHDDITVEGLKDMTLSSAGETEAHKIKIKSQGNNNGYCFTILTSGQSYLTQTDWTQAGSCS